MTIQPLDAARGRRHRARTLTGILGVGSLIAALALPLAAQAAPNDGSALFGQNWQLRSVTALPSGFTNMTGTGTVFRTDAGVSFQVPFGVAGLDGTHAVYLLTNYNRSLPANGSITVTANWTGATYVTRSTTDTGAFGRLEFQDVANGPFEANDYWWYSGQNFNLNTATSGTFTAALSDRSHWTDICGQSAADKTVRIGPDCVGGNYPGIFGYVGFTNALQNVKEISISFGRTSAYASGIATTGTDPAYFNLTNLGIS